METISSDMTSWCTSPISSLPVTFFVTAVWTIQITNEVYTFEQELAQRCGVRHALAVTSESAALICALRAIDLQPGDAIIVPAYTFIATFSSIIFCGGVPVHAEIEQIRLIREIRDFYSFNFCHFWL